MAETKDKWNSIFWTFLGTVFAVTIAGIVLSLVVAAAEDRRDSMGIPCTISTAQNADGSPECQ
jgi:hypothetical protein